MATFDDEAGNVLWLRQSVTVTKDGQARTLEVRVPIATDAAPDEIERLVAQANRALDTATRSFEAHQPATPARAPAAAAPHPARPVTPLAPAPSVARPAVAPSAAPPTEPTRHTPPPPAPARASQPPSAPAKPAEPSPASAGPDMTRPQFLAAAADLGFNAKEAMEKLGVRTLEGLHLREALESLRRVALRDQAVPVSPAASFAEEEGPEMTFSLVESDELIDSYDAPGSAPDEYELEDVPSLGELDELAAAVVNEDRARSIVAQLRTAIAGGTPTADRKTAYTNIVVEELGESRARALIRGVWRLTPERLGPEQYDAIIRWGKLDTFSAEAEAVLKLLASEQGPADGKQPAAKRPENEKQVPATRASKAPARPQPRTGGA